MKVQNNQSYTKKNKQKDKPKNVSNNTVVFIKGVAIAFVFCGLLLSLMNLYKYSIGFFANKKESKYDQSKDISFLDGEYKIETSLNIIAKALSRVVNQSYDSTSEKINKDTTSNNALGNLETVQNLYEKTPAIGEEIGELYIPKIESILPIYHGTSEDELEKGVGHFADSVLPGVKDNSVLSGHRDTVFRKLGNVREGDLLIVRTTAGEFTYKVNKVRIVDDDDRTVIVPKPRATLTVSTCYPFDYIGSAPQRYILVAYLESSTLYTQ